MGAKALRPAPRLIALISGRHFRGDLAGRSVHPLISKRMHRGHRAQLKFLWRCAAVAMVFALQAGAAISVGAREQAHCRKAHDSVHPCEHRRLCAARLKTAQWRLATRPHTQEAQLEGSSPAHPCTHCAGKKLTPAQTRTVLWYNVGSERWKGYRQRNRPQPTSTSLKRWQGASASTRSQQMAAARWGATVRPLPQMPT